MGSPLPANKQPHELLTADFGTAPHNLREYCRRRLHHPRRNNSGAAGRVVLRGIEQHRQQAPQAVLQQVPHM